LHKLKPHQFSVLQVLLQQLAQALEGHLPIFGEARALPMAQGLHFTPLSVSVVS
jgi:hypothetical protein